MVGDNELPIVEEQLRIFLAKAEQFLLELRVRQTELFDLQEALPLWSIIRLVTTKYRYAKAESQIYQVVGVMTRVEGLITSLDHMRRAELISRLLDLDRFDDGHGYCSHLNPCFHLTLACWVLHGASIPEVFSNLGAPPRLDYPATE